MMTAAMILEMSAGMSKHDFEYTAKAVVDVSHQQMCHTSNGGDGEAKDSDMQPLGFGGSNNFFQKMTKFRCTSRFTTHL